jgi:hypothetical protein
LKKVAFIFPIIIIVFLIICFIKIRNTINDDTFDMGIINEENFEYYSKFVYGINDEITFIEYTDIQNVKIPHSITDLYKRGKKIKAIYEDDNNGILPNMYFLNKGICIIKGEEKLKKGNVIKISYLTNLYNPVRFGYMYKNKAYVSVSKVDENYRHEVKITVPKDGLLDIILYNEKEEQTCIIDAEIKIE